MEDKKFLKYFLISLFIFLISFVTFVEVINPSLTGRLDLRFFEPWTTNIEYVKFKRIGKVEDVETIILGSSTSEAYHTSDMDKLFNTKSYALSLGGADTPTRSIFFKQAVKEFKKLKRIIYVADFFEFNKESAKAEVAFNREMGKELAPIARPNLLRFIRYYLNHQLLEDGLNVLKRKKKNKKITIGLNGATSRSMVLSPIQAKSGYRTLLKEEEKKKLMEYVLENAITYSRSVLNDFNQLNPVIKSLYREMIALAKEENIEIIFVLSPYHFEFRKKLMKLEKISDLYEKWQEEFIEYEREDNISVINATKSYIATEPMSGAWRDGIHYSREAVFKILEDSID